MQSALARTLTTLFVLAAPLAAAETPTQRPDLSGRWQIDTARSDIGGGRGGGTAREGPGGDRPEERREPRAGGGEVGFGDRGAMRAQWQAAVATLEFTRTGDAGWSLRDGLGTIWSIEPDGRERTLNGPDGGELYLRADWTSRNGLMVRRVQAGRPTIEETYELAADGKTLTVVARMSGGSSGDRELHRVYVPASDPAK